MLTIIIAGIKYSLITGGFMKRFIFGGLFCLIAFAAFSSKAYSEGLSAVDVMGTGTKAASVESCMPSADKLSSVGPFRGEVASVYESNGKVVIKFTDLDEDAEADFVNESQKSFKERAAIICPENSGKFDISALKAKLPENKIHIVGQKSLENGVLQIYISHPLDIVLEKQKKEPHDIQPRPMPLM